MAKRTTTPKTPARIVRKPASPKAAAPKAPKAPRTLSTPSTLSTLSTSSNSLDILMVTPEARPFAKTGGLADVCGALPRALAALGHRVTILLPQYPSVVTGGAAGAPAPHPLRPPTPPG